MALLTDKMIAMYHILNKLDAGKISKEESIILIDKLTS